MPKHFQGTPGRLRDKPSTWLSAILAMPERHSSRGYWSLIVAALVLIIGAIDYATGYEASVMVFYLLPVALAVVTMGWMGGVATAVVSMVISLIGDLAAGAHYLDRLTPWWNALIVLAIYLVVIWLLATLIAINTKLLAIHRELEERVRQRTEALTQEIAERERLEKAVLEIARRERTSIGQDLHDGLGQYLTGTAIAMQMLVNKLEQRQAEETADARKVVKFIEQAIEDSRKLAKGFLLAEIEPSGLIAALEELAAATRRQFNVPCVFRCQNEISFHDDDAPTHLYHIAQEAVRNALRHGRPRNIEIVLSVEQNRLSLSVQDDGTGLPPQARHGPGLGLRIMAHRAIIINAEFAIETPAGGGTLVLCARPHPHSPS
jgi:signal transduction histidine kinase